MMKTIPQSFTQNTNQRSEKVKKHRYLQLFKLLSAMILGLITFLLYESLIILSISILGEMSAFLVLIFVNTSICFFIIYFYNKKSENDQLYFPKFQKWVTNKEKNLSPTSIKIAKTSKFFVFIFSTLTAGPVITTIATNFFNDKTPTNYTFSFLSSILFSFTWITFYSKSINILRGII